MRKEQLIISSAPVFPLKQTRPYLLEFHEFKKWQERFHGAPEGRASKIGFGHGCPMAKNFNNTNRSASMWKTVSFPHFNAICHPK